VSRAPSQSTAGTNTQSELDRLMAMEAKIESIRPDRLAEMKSRFQAAFTLASVRKELLACFTPEMMRTIRELENTPIGFRTDRPNEKNNSRYDDQTIKECVCEAIMRGLQLYGNEFNIIAGRVYVTSEGLGRILSETDGLANLSFNYGLPRVQDRGAVVPVEASWVFKGVPGGFKTEIAVRLNANMGADGAVGKAQRKARYRVLTTISGSTWVPVDGEVEADQAAAAGPSAPHTDSAKELTRLIAQLPGGAPSESNASSPGSAGEAPATLTTPPTRSSSPSPVGAPSGTKAPESRPSSGGARSTKPKPAPLPPIETPSDDDGFAQDIVREMDKGARKGPNASTVDITA